MNKRSRIECDWVQRAKTKGREQAGLRSEEIQTEETKDYCGVDTDNDEQQNREDYHLSKAVAALLILRKMVK
jgi:hypothetical protein